MQNVQGYKTLTDIFNSTASKYPSNIAITHINGEKRECITYKELDHLSTCISTCLRPLGAHRKVIGILSHQNAKLIALLLGVLKVPAAFAPVGLDWPPKMTVEFVNSLHSTFQAFVVQNDLVENFNKILQLLNANTEVRFEKVENKTLDLIGFVIYIKMVECTGFTVEQNLAYIMQTSGTTGSPKTVQVPHECIVPNVTSLASMFDVSTEDCVALISPYTFDPFIVQLFIALSSGASVAIVPDCIKTQPNKLCKLLFDELHITVLQPTPSLVYTMGLKQITTRLLGRDSTLKVLAFGGEPIPAIKTLKEWKHSNCKTQIFNLYGITEVSSWASCYKITDHILEAGSNHDICGNDELKEIINNTVPIGLPLDDTVIEVRDGDGSIIKEGIGTIYVGGKRRVCYLDKETEPQIMRATGDLGYIHNEQIWYYGRQNRQIKRMGKRMNLEWIEQTLVHAYPDFIFVCATESKPSRMLQDKIHLFVKPPLSQQTSNQHMESIKQKLQELLPQYAHPDNIYIVDEIPTTSHGKVNSKKLLDDYCSRKTIHPSIIPIQEFLIKTWLECTRKEGSISQLSVSENSKASENNELDSQKRNGLERRNDCVDDTDRFIESGGTSIDAVRMIGQVEEWLSLKVGSLLDLSELLEVILNGTFGGLCQYINMKISEVRKPLPSCTAVHNVSHDNALLNPHHSSQNTHVPVTSLLSRQSHNLGDVCLKAKVFTSHSFERSATNQVSSPPNKRTKIEQPHNPSDTDFCFCSIQRGMRSTRCSYHQNQEKEGNLSEQTFSNSLTTDHLKFKVETCWKVDFHKCIDGSPLLVGRGENAVIYLGSHGHVFKAVSLSDGKVLWETRVGDRIESSATLSQCGVFVIVGCYDGKVYVFNRYNGSIAWTFQTSGPVKSSPCVDPSTGLVWIGSHDHHLYSLDVNRHMCEASFNCGASCFSSPQVLPSHSLLFEATLTGQLFAICTSRMTIVWTSHCPKPIFATPLVTSQSVVCACVDGKIYSYSLTGELQWKFKTSGPIFSSPSVFTSSIIFGCHDKNVYCISGNGKLKWQLSADSEVYGTPFVTQLNFAGEGNMTCIDRCATSTMGAQNNHTEKNECSKSVVWVCSTKGTLYCVCLDSGNVMTTWVLPGPVFSSPVVLGNKILVGCRDDYLYCLEYVLLPHNKPEPLVTLWNADNLSAFLRFYLA